ARAVVKVARGDVPYAGHAGGGFAFVDVVAAVVHEQAYRSVRSRCQAVSRRMVDVVARQIAHHPDAKKVPATEAELAHVVNVVARDAHDNPDAASRQAAPTEAAADAPALKLALSAVAAAVL